MKTIAGAGMLRPSSAMPTSTTRPSARTSVSARVAASEVPAHSNTTAGPQHERGDQPDRSRADDGDRCVGVDAGLGGRVHADRDRLSERRAGVVELVGQREQHAGVDQHALGVAARAPGAQADAAGPGVRAHLLLAGKAELALAALRERQHADALAHTPAFDARADCADPPRDLMPGDGASLSRVVGSTQQTHRIRADTS